MTHNHQQKGITLTCKTTCETNFDRLVKLGILNDGKPVQRGRSRSDGFMDLVIEALPHLDNVNGIFCKAFSMAHYFEQNGDLCQDPEMLVLVYAPLPAVEAYDFQQAVPLIHQVVFAELGKAYPRLRRDLNSFLWQWVVNLVEHGHGTD